jgi:hypothetical protein
MADYPESKMFSIFNDSKLPKLTSNHVSSDEHEAPNEFLIRNLPSTFRLFRYIAAVANFKMITWLIAVNYAMEMSSE